VNAERDKTLLLLRHAKSAWPDVPDHERPLAGRGRRDAPIVGRWLRESDRAPEQVLCSTARRARETWQLAQTTLNADPPVAFEAGIYGASSAELLELIRDLPSRIRTAIVVGHDPAIQDVALELSAVSSGTDADSATTAALDRMRTKFPTAAVAVLSFGGPWSKLTARHARLAAFVTPRDLAAR